MSRTAVTLPNSIIALGTILLSTALWVSEGRADWLSNGNPLATMSGHQSSSSMVYDGIDGAIVAWEDTRGTPGVRELYAIRVTRAGGLDPAWPADGLLLVAAASDKSRPQVVSDGVGGAYVVWRDDRAGNWDIYAQRVTRWGTIADGWPISGLPICSDPGFQDEHLAVSDGFGGLLVAWIDFRTKFTFSVFAKRVTLDTSSPSGWAPDGNVAVSSVSQHFLTGLAPNGSGGVFVGLVRDDDIFVQQLSSTGSRPAGWPTAGLAVSTLSVNQSETRVVSDGTDGVFVVWTDYRADGDIYAQRVDGAAGFLLPSNGVPVCGSAGQQALPTATADGAGGVTVAWKDLRSGGPEIYAQRIDPTGTAHPSWPASGRLLGGAGSTTGTNLAILGQEDGGAIVTWDDPTCCPSVPRNIFAQKVTGDGGIATGWPAAGLLVCAETSEQQRPALTSDGAGGALIAWQDFRNGLDWDQFVGRVTSSGNTGETVGIPGLGQQDGFVVHGPTPNPTPGPVQFRLQLSGLTTVQAAVFDVQGRRVGVLEPAATGPSDMLMRWDGRNDQGKMVRTGIYFVRFIVGDRQRVATVSVAR